jgi:hypothetical protein
VHLQAAKTSRRIPDIITSLTLPVPCPVQLDDKFLPFPTILSMKQRLDSDKQNPDTFDMILCHACFPGKKQLTIVTDNPEKKASTSIAATQAMIPDLSTGKNHYP